MDYGGIEVLLKQKTELETLIKQYDKITGFVEFQSWEYTKLTQRISELETQIFELDKKIRELL